jgi:nitrilase
MRPLTWQAMAEYLAHAVEIPSPTTDQLCEAAKIAGIDVVIGVVERDAVTAGTVYCTLLFIGREGRILGRHRKIKPTFHERSVWGEGDAAGLKTYRRPYGRISGLNCWEHHTMLPGYVLASEGTQIHVAAWPGREPAAAPPSPNPLWPRQLLLSRAFASQAACYVIAVGGVRLHSDTPDRYRELSTFEHTGDSTIIDPRGEIIAGPAQGETITDRGRIEADRARRQGGVRYWRALLPAGSAPADRRPQSAAADDRARHRSRRGEMQAG